jgi:hypothetical protein
MILLRMGSYGLFARHAGNYPRWAMLTVGGLMPLTLVLWACWLYLTVAPLPLWRWRPAYGSVQRFAEAEFEALMTRRAAAPACVADLGLRLPCTAEDVRFAFRHKSKTLHPDRGGDVQQFIALRRAYEDALRFVSRTPPPGAATIPLEAPQVAVLDAAGRKRTRTARGAAATLRVLAMVTCLATAGVMAGSSRWVAVYHTDDMNEWVAVGAGAIEFMSRPNGGTPAPGAARPSGWSIESRAQTLRWWPRVVEAEESAIVTVPLWILLAAIAAPTALMWRRR